MRRISAGEFTMGNESSVADVVKMFPGSDKSWFEDAVNRHSVRITKPFYLGQHEVTVGQFRKFIESSRYKTDAESDGNVGDGTAKAKFPNWTNTIQAKDGFATTAPVGSFAENPWGLYDMHGNVWEWCQDCYGDYATGAVTDPVGDVEKEGSDRVFRGGGWSSIAGYCRSAFRVRRSPGNRDSDLGFRVALVPTGKKAVLISPGSRHRGERNVSRRSVESVAEQRMEVPKYDA